MTYNEHENYLKKKISRQSLLKKTDNVYKLVRAAAMRTKKLNLGSNSYLDKLTSKNYSTIALQEIAEDKIKIVRKSEIDNYQDNSIKILFQDEDEKEQSEDKE